LHPDWDWLAPLTEDGNGQAGTGSWQKTMRVGCAVLLPWQEGEMAVVGAGTVVCTLLFQPALGDPASAGGLD